MWYVLLNSSYLLTYTVHQLNVITTYQSFVWFIIAVLKATANADRERQRKERLDEDRKK